MELNAVRTLRVVGRSEGVDRVAADLRDVADAQQAVAVSSDTMTRRQTSVARSFASLNAQVDPAVRAQQQFTRAQQIADRALQQAVITQNEHAKVVEQARQKYLGMVPANENVARSTGLARYELINLSRQIQDVGVSLAGGQSPFTVLAQQGTQIGDIFASSNGTLRGFVGQVAALVNPVTVLAVGTVALGAAAYGAWRFWKDFALTLDDTARAAGVTSSEMAKLQAAASFRGIGTDDFAGAMKTFSAEVYRAQNGMGSLAELARANGQSVKGTSDAMDRVANLIRNAAGDQQRLQLLQQAGLPATMEWVRLLSGGADGLKRAKDEAVAFGGAANDEMIAKAREFDEAWNKAATNLGLYLRSATTEAGGWLSRLTDNATGLLIKIDAATSRSGRSSIPTNVLRDAMTGGLTTGGTRLDSGTASQFYDAVGLRAGSKATVDPQKRAFDLSKESQRLGILSQLGSVTDQVRQKEIEIIQARASGVDITEAEAAALLKLAEAQALGTLQMQQQIGQYQIEAATIGMSTGAAAAYRAEQEKILEFRIRGITLMDAKIAAIHKEAQALGEAAQRASDFRQISQLTTDFATGFARDLRQGVSALDALGNALNRLADKLIEMAIQNLVTKALGGLGNGGLSFLSGLLPSADGNVFAGGNVTPFALGGIVTRPTIFSMATGAGLMGEAGPEAVMPLRRTPDGRLGVAAQGGGSPIVNVNVSNNAGAEVGVGQATRNADGSIDLDVVIDRAVAGRMASGRSATAKAAGLRPRLRG